MKELIDFDGALVFAVQARATYPGFPACEGMLIEGPQAWGEFCPPAGSDDLTAARWLTAAVEGGTVGWPDAVRGRVPIAVAVPAVDPDEAGAIVAAGGCRSADVRVTGGPDDAARLAAVRAALGADGAIRAVVQGTWDVDTAVAAIPVLAAAAGGLQFVQHPCGTGAELAAVRRRVEVPIAVDVAALDAGSPALAEIADVVVLTVGPLGGVRRALRIAERCDLPCLVAAAAGAGETSIGLAGGLALAGALPDLPFACGLGTVVALAGDVVSAGRALIPADGHLPVAPMAPGPDAERVAELAVADPEQVAVWRRRLSAARELL
ncbi:enolase C-terminal domain-like protein [Mycobacterium sp. shizuoka-1]|uniref:enolase C-terminal domain-like protein n=1 Tax=Mycobacterium sp. shizuoka-1 TaxID=2039281 RepID=UPI000C061E2E|nr:enolase C-terminal domain-like protein [Mycobacterium sp. shizuoka-1]GAY15470.1 o-succinylbenzoate synthase [Mycobacterium sp. shizuoka-1]